VLTPGNLIVSVNDFTGAPSPPTYIAEYTTTGTRVQTLASVPEPGGTGPTADWARDLILGPGNAVHLYNGTFDPYLARLDLGTATWAQQTVAGWSTQNDISFGGLDRLGQYVYATDMETADPGAPRGVVRFDTAGGPSVRFAETSDPIDLDIGPDGSLYALHLALSKEIHKYDPMTFASLGTVSLDNEDNRALGVAADGSIFVATWEGKIKRFSATGDLLDSLSLPSVTNFTDLNISPTGQIALGTRFAGDIVLTDLSLDSYSRFHVTDTTYGDVFVDWVNEPVPEPSSLALLASAGATLAGWVVVRVGRTRAQRLRLIKDVQT
jgi:hypothetical protein